MADFTPRELEVLRLLVNGSSNKAIAASLRVTQKTVEFHLDNIYEKVGIRGRLMVVVWALKHGVLGETRESPS